MTHQKLDCLGRSCFFFPFSGTARSLQNRFVSVAVSPRGRDQWERSVRVSGSGETLGLRDPVEDEAKGRSGLGPFLHPPSRKTPTPFFVKMFAVAAQTTVRATAQVKATKVAAKEQKSAYVPSRFPASSISLRFFHPRRSAASALRRGDDDDESRAAFARGRVAHRRVSIPRVSHAATVARVFARRLRARPRRANNEIVETSRADETLTETVSLPLLRPQFPLLQGCRRRRRAVPVRVPRRVRGRPHAAERHQLRARQVRAALLRSPPRGGG